MDAHKLAGQTSLRSSKVSEDIASDLEKKWKTSVALDCIEGKLKNSTQFAHKRYPHLIVHFSLLHNLCNYV
jgi:hypothetical protein